MSGGDINDKSEPGYPVIPFSASRSRTIEDQCDDFIELLPTYDEEVLIQEVTKFVKAMKDLNDAFKQRCIANNRPEDYYDDEGVSGVKRDLEQIVDGE